MLWVFCGGTAEPTSIPEQQLQPVALCIGENKNMSAQGLTKQTVAHHAVQSFESLAHVGRSRRQVDASRWPQTEHRLGGFQHTDELLQRDRIKAALHFDPASVR